MLGDLEPVRFRVLQGEFLLKKMRRIRPSRALRLGSMGAPGGCAAPGRKSSDPCFRNAKPRTQGTTPHFWGEGSYCGRNPSRTTWKPWETIVCWYLQGNHQKPGFLRWCRILSIHSITMVRNTQRCPTTEVGHHHSHEKGRTRIVCPESASYLAPTYSFGNSHRVTSATWVPPFLGEEPCAVGLTWLLLTLRKVFGWFGV